MRSGPNGLGRDVGGRGATAPSPCARARRPVREQLRTRAQDVLTAVGDHAGSRPVSASVRSSTVADPETVRFRAVDAPLPPGPRTAGHLAVLVYADQAHLTRDFRAMFGESPTRYAQRYRASRGPESRSLGSLTSSALELLA